MKRLALVFGTLFFALQASASSKICYGSTKDETTKGAVLKAEISEISITLKAIKGEFAYDAIYPALKDVVNGRDGKTYRTFQGESADDREYILVDQNLFQMGTTGLLQIRARGEGFANSVFICRDNNPAKANLDPKIVQALRDDVTEAGFQLASVQGTESLDPKSLKGAAKLSYEEAMKDFGDDYPPVVAAKAYSGVKVVFVEELNDGGGLFEVYDQNGRFIMGISGGESSGWDNWD